MISLNSSFCMKSFGQMGVLLVWPFLLSPCQAQTTVFEDEFSYADNGALEGVWGTPVLSGDTPGTFSYTSTGTALRGDELIDLTTGDPAAIATFTHSLDAPLSGDFLASFTLSWDATATQLNMPTLLFSVHGESSLIAAVGHADVHNGISSGGLGFPVGQVGGERAWWGDNGAFELGAGGIEAWFSTSDRNSTPEAGEWDFQIRRIGNQLEILGPGNSSGVHNITDPSLLSDVTALSIDFGLIGFTETQPATLSELSVEHISLQSNPEPPMDLFTWGVDASGDWNNELNWTRTSAVPVPNASDHTVIFGDATSSPRTVFTDTAVTVNRVQFDHVNGYAVAGQGSVNFETSTEGPTAPPTIEVNSGSHEFQLDVSILNDTAITVGDGTELDFNGVINLGANDLTIDRAGGFAMDGVVNINNTVTGSGTLTNNATLGTGGATAIGGSLASSGTLDIDITPNSIDSFVVSGNATLSGTLDVDLQDGFIPTSDIPVVLVSGTLNAVGLSLGGPDGGLFTLSTESGSVVLSLTSGGLPGDFNIDGIVNAADYVVWRKTGGSQTQYNTWRANFGQPSGSSSEVGAVPEPTTLVLCLLAALTVASPYFAKRK